jgi:hypothetical protein
MSASLGTSTILKRFEAEPRLSTLVIQCQPPTTAQAGLTIPAGLIIKQGIETFNELRPREPGTPEAYMLNRFRTFGGLGIACPHVIVPSFAPRLR